MSDMKQLPFLIKLFDDDSEFVRNAVLSALAEFGDELPTALDGLAEPISAAERAAVLSAVEDFSAAATR